MQSGRPPTTKTPVFHRNFYAEFASCSPDDIGDLRRSAPRFARNWRSATKSVAFDPWNGGVLDRGYPSSVPRYGSCAFARPRAKAQADLSLVSSTMSIDQPLDRRLPSSAPGNDLSGLMSLTGDFATSSDGSTKRGWAGNTKLFRIWVAKDILQTRTVNSSGRTTKPKWKCRSKSRKR